MESEQLFHRGYYRNSYNSITSASSDEELLDGAGVIMDFQTSEDDNLLDGDASIGKLISASKFPWVVFLCVAGGFCWFLFCFGLIWLFC